jgi:uncharacterized protein
MATDITVVRVYLSEADHVHHKSLMQKILNILHDQQRVHGVTVFRGIAGFGDSGEVHESDLLRIAANLPLVIEFFDAPPVADAAMDLLKDLVPPNRMVYWRAASR